MRKLFTILAFLVSLSASAISNRQAWTNFFERGYFTPVKWYVGSGQKCWDKYGTGFCTPPGNIQPGDTIAFKSTDATTSFSLINYHGTVTDSIVLINEGGQVSMGAIGMTHCSYIILNGWGAVGVTYGFKLSGPPEGDASPAVNISGRSKSINVYGIESYKHGYAVMCKTDMSCVDSTNYPNWVMDSIKIHDGWAHNTGQDVIYAGNTSPSGVDFDCGSGIVHKYPMLLSNIWIYNWIIDSANRTGVQLGLAKNGWIYNNTITRMGYEYNQAQGTGISIGGTSENIHVYNNNIKYTFLYGIMCFGRKRNYVENNIVDSSGFLPIDPYNDIDSLLRKRDTILHVDNATWNTSFYHFSKTGHTFINTYSQPSCLALQPDRNYYGILEGTQASDSSTIVWNGNRVGASVVIDASYNYIGGNANKLWMNDMTAQGKNPIGYFNFICNNTLLDGMTPAAITTGGKHYSTDCSSFPALAPSAYAGVDQTITLPTSSVNLSGIGIPASGQSISYYWEKISGPATYTITSPSTASTSVTGLVQGTYMFRLTVTQSDEQTAIDMVQITVNPAAGVPFLGGKVRGAFGGGFVSPGKFKIQGKFKRK